MPLLLAAEGIDSSAIVTAVTTSFTGIVTNCLSVLSAVLPVGLTIFSMYMIVGFSKKMFKKITGA